MKKYIVIFVVMVLSIVSGCGNSNESEITVFVEIDCSDILNNYDLLDENLRDEKYVPSDGMILEKTEVNIPEGSGALEVLKAVAKEKDIQVDISDGYAKGINYIYEKSCGSMSGWIYEVNGEPVMTEYIASENDTISWKYICDFSNFGM